MPNLPIRVSLRSEFQGGHSKYVQVWSLIKNGPLLPIMKIVYQKLQWQ